MCRAGKYIREHRERGWTKWRVATHEHAFLGRAGFGGDDHERGLNYAIRRAFWGRRLAIEIAEAFVDWHLCHANSIPLGALVEAGNDASVRMLEKIGFTEAGVEMFRRHPLPGLSLADESVDLSIRFRAQCPGHALSRAPTTGGGPKPGR